MRHALPILLALGACSDSGLLDETPIPELELTVTSPTYGAFEGNDVTVTGKLVPADASVYGTLVIEEQPVTILEDGSFTVTLPFEKAYRIIDVEASYFEQVLTARIPVFRGRDPIETWPGAITGRLTPDGLDGLSALLEGLVPTLLSDQLLGGIGGGAPLFEAAGFALSFEGITLGDVGVDLAPGESGLAATFTINDVVLGTKLTGDLFGTPIELPANLVFPVIVVEAVADIRLGDDGGIVFGLGDLSFDLDIPEIVIGGADLGWLADLLESFIDVQSLVDNLLGNQLQGFEVPLGGPIAFETDLLGTSLAIELQELDTDPLGLAFGLGVGLGSPIPPESRDLPVPTGEGAPPSDVLVVLHDGVLQSLLRSDLLSLLDQDLQLPGFLGGFLTPLIGGLPGGEQLPENNGWCINLQPGEARVARFGPSAEEPLVGIYLPDARVTFAYVDSVGGGCVPWLETSLALEVYLDLDGTALGFDIQVAEGIVLAYGATVDDEQAVVDQLGGVLQSLLGLLGGALGGGLDLGDLLGGIGGAAGLPTDGLNLEITSRRPFPGADGQVLEGTTELGLNVF